MSQRLGDPHELHFLAQPPMSYLSVADSAGVIPDLAFDYDLSSATVHHLRVERAGTHLTAFLQLAVVRTFATDESASTQPALLQLALEDLTEVAFDFRDTQGAVLDPAADEIAISVGAGWQVPRHKRRVPPRRPLVVPVRRRPPHRRGHPTPHRPAKRPTPAACGETGRRRGGRRRPSAPLDARDSLGPLRGPS